MTSLVEFLVAAMNMILNQCGGSKIQNQYQQFFPCITGLSDTSPHDQGHINDKKTSLDRNFGDNFLNDAFL